MKSTLFLIGSLLCLLFFAMVLALSGVEFTPDSAYSEVVDANAASMILSDCNAFNSVIGVLLVCITSVAVLGGIVSLFLLQRQRVLRWFRVGLLLVNIAILLVNGVLFAVSFSESLQPAPACLQLQWPYQESYFTRAIHHARQSAMFMGFCGGMLSGVNCLAFYFFYRRRSRYSH